MGSGVFLGQPVAYPSPHLPPYPSPTMIQPIAQLRQPYIVTLTSQVTLTSTRKPSHGKRNSVPDDIPIRLAVTFAPSRARVLQGVHANFPRRPKASDSLFVMANHGQLLEYSLDPVPDLVDKVHLQQDDFFSSVKLNPTTFSTAWSVPDAKDGDRCSVTCPGENNSTFSVKCEKSILDKKAAPPHWKGLGRVSRECKVLQGQDKEKFF